VCKLSSKRVANLSTVASEQTTNQDFDKHEHRCPGPSIRCSHLKVPHWKEWASSLKTRRDSAHAKLVVHKYSATQCLVAPHPTFLCSINVGIISVTSPAAILETSSNYEAAIFILRQSYVISATTTHYLAYQYWCQQWMRIVARS